MIARVRGERASRTASGERHSVSGSMSTSTGTAFARTTEDALATQVSPGTITSSSAPTPSASIAIRRALLPFEVQHRLRNRY